MKGLLAPLYVADSEVLTLLRIPKKSGQSEAETQGGATNLYSLREKIVMRGRHCPFPSLV